MSRGNRDQADSLGSSCSRSFRSLSSVSVACRVVSASLFSCVVNGPVGGRFPRVNRSRKLRKRFIARKRNCSGSTLRFQAVAERSKTLPEAGQTPIRVYEDHDARHVDYGEGVTRAYDSREEPSRQPTRSRRTKSAKWSSRNSDQTVDPVPWLRRSGRRASREGLRGSPLRRRPTCRPRGCSGVVVEDVAGRWVRGERCGVTIRAARLDRVERRAHELGELLGRRVLVPRHRRRPPRTGENLRREPRRRRASGASGPSGRGTSRCASAP
jgi:hypothetical protein